MPNSIPSLLPGENRHAHPGPEQASRSPDQRLRHTRPILDDLQRTTGPSSMPPKFADTRRSWFGRLVARVRSRRHLCSRSLRLMSRHRQRRSNPHVRAGISRIGRGRAERPRDVIGHGRTRPLGAHRSRSPDRNRATDRHRISVNSPASQSNFCKGTSFVGRHAHSAHAAYWTKVGSTILRAADGDCASTMLIPSSGSGPPSAHGCRGAQMIWFDISVQSAQRVIDGLPFGRITHYVNISTPRRPAAREFFSDFTTS